MGFTNHKINISQSLSASLSACPSRHTGSTSPSQDMDDPILLSRPQPDILLITLNRPQNRNAVTGSMISSFCKALENASVDSSIRVVVITGNPLGRAFCAGADLSPQAGAFGQATKKKSAVPHVANFRDGGGFSSLAALRCTKPIIAAINGSAVGWGLAITLACDIRIVSEKAKCGFTMVARGLVNESCSSYLLPRIIGNGKAKELVFTGRVFKASDASVEAPGLFNYIVPEDQVLTRALEIGREIADNASGMAVATCKYLMDESWDVTIEETMLMESEALHHVSYIKKKDLKEGIASFLERRKPTWVHDAWDDLPRFVRVGLATRRRTVPPPKQSKL